VPLPRRRRFREVWACAPKPSEESFDTSSTRSTVLRTVSDIEVDSRRQDRVATAPADQHAHYEISPSQTPHTPNSSGPRPTFAECAQRPAARRRVAEHAETSQTQTGHDRNPAPTSVQLHDDVAIITVRLSRAEQALEAFEPPDIHRLEGCPLSPTGAPERDHPEGRTFSEVDPLEPPPPTTRCLAIGLGERASTVCIGRTRHTLLHIDSPRTTRRRRPSAPHNRAEPSLKLGAFGPSLRRTNRHHHNRHRSAGRVGRRPRCRGNPWRR
jgi:hypothetical protein